LPELFYTAQREPLQDEVPEVRLLFELLGFLLKTALGYQPSIGNIHPHEGRASAGGGVV
jgi:hypothetical protein